MLVDRNQHFPFTFQGAADDVVVYPAIRKLTTPPEAEPRLRVIVETDAEAHFPPPESQGGWRKLDDPGDAPARRDGSGQTG